MHTIKASSSVGLFALAIFIGTADCLAQPADHAHTELKKRYLKTPQAFEKDRQKYVNQHLRSGFSAKVVLNDSERKLALVLSNHVKAILTNNHKNAPFGPARPFYEAKAGIASTEAFRFLKNMPKGALLHAHLNAVGRIDWVISNAVTHPNCYVKWSPDSGDHGTLRFLTPQKASANGYVLASQKAAELPPNGPESFAEKLRAALTIDATDVDPSKRSWAPLNDLFAKTGGFVRHRSVLTNYLFDAFQTLWNDHVYYIELRDSFGQLWDIDEGKYGTEQDFIDHFQIARKMMQDKHPLFDCRLIFADYRPSSAETLIANLERTMELRAQHSDLVVGFDLIGEEFGSGDDSTQLKVATVLKALTTTHQTSMAAQKRFGSDQHCFPYYLHNGESAWADNENLFDAVTLGTPRIGHAFNLYRFPSLYREIIDKDIALEICPISNQLLGLSPDLRTHPAAGYLNAGIQCTISSDDPLYFGNDGLSYDFWEALVAWNLDLGSLKQLARNSIHYSGANTTLKTQLMEHWTNQWNQFIQSSLTNQTKQQHAVLNENP